jgi:hypothetical protein
MWMLTWTITLKKYTIYLAFNNKVSNQHVILAEESNNWSRAISNFASLPWIIWWKKNVVQRFSNHLWMVWGESCNFKKRKKKRSGHIPSAL